MKDNGKRTTSDQSGMTPMSDPVNKPRLYPLAWLLIALLVIYALDH